MGLDITIKMKDGTTKEFKHRPRPGGSYTNSVDYETGFVVITDEWGSMTAIPNDLIAEVKMKQVY